MQSQTYGAHIRTRQRFVVQESLKESMISNYEFCCCLVGALMKVSSGLALIVDKQLNDCVRKRHSQEANWTDHGLSRAAYQT